MALTNEYQVTWQDKNTIREGMTKQRNNEVALYNEILQYVQIPQTPDGQSAATPRNPG